MRAKTLQVGGLKDWQTLCVCDKDPTGTKLMPTGIPEQYSERKARHMLKTFCLAMLAFPLTI